MLFRRRDASPGPCFSAGSNAYKFDVFLQSIIFPFPVTNRTFSHPRPRNPSDNKAGNPSDLRPPCTFGICRKMVRPSLAQGWPCKSSRPLPICEFRSAAFQFLLQSCNIAKTTVPTMNPVKKIPHPIKTIPHHGIFNLSSSKDYVVFGC